MLSYELTVIVMFKVVWEPGTCVCISVIKLRPLTSYIALNSLKAQ